MREQYIQPYLIIVGFLAVTLLLVLLRRHLLRKATGPLLQIGNGQTIGSREEQDDYFSTVHNRMGTIAVLADGISGLSKGRLASTIAVTTFIREFMKLDDLSNISHYFTKAARSSNSEILRQFRGARGGTTVVAVIIRDGYLYWGAVGDSLIKIFRNEELLTINQVHTLESVLMQRYLVGEISQQAASNNPMKRRLINYLGYEEFKNIEIGKEAIQLQKNDKVILLSDGVTNTLTEVELEQLLSQKIPAYDIAQEIIGAVEGKRLKNQDNATVVILEKGW